MDFPEALSLLDPALFKTVKLRKRDYECLELVYLSDPLSSASIISPDSICFGSASQFNSIADQYLTSGSFILSLDEPLKILPADIAVVVCPSRSAMRDCYERLASAFREMRHIKEGVLSLTLLASRGAGLKALIDRISNIFGIPANILDTSLAIVAHSENFPVWVTDGSEQGNGFLPERAQVRMKEQGLVGGMEPSKVTVFSWDDLRGNICFNHFVPISIGNTIIGSLSVFTQGKPLPRSRTALLPTIANILSIEMQKASSYTLNKSMYYSHLFDDLMSGQMSESPEAIRYRFSVFGYNLRTYKRIVYVDLSGDYFDSSQTQALATRFHRVLENNVYVVRDRNILLLTSTDVRTDEGITSKGRMLGEMGMIHSSLHGDDSEDAATSKALGSLKGVLEIAQEVGVRVGVSSAFTNVLQAPSHLIQARHAIISGRRYDPDGYVHLFSRYRMADILTHIDDPHALYSFRYPPLMMLIAEDSEHGTHLAWTLYVHLQEPAQPTLTCKRLFIHKNTLYYRLDRIRDIMGVDVKDGWVITQVMMTFLVLMHQGKFEELVLPKEKDPAAAKDRRGRRSRKDTPAKGSASAEGDAR